MQKVAFSVLIVVVMFLAIAVVPAFAEDEPVSNGPLHCAFESPFGEALRGAPSQGEGGGDYAGGTPADPPADQAGEGSSTGDGKSWENGEICGPTREDGPPRDDPTP